MPDFWFDADSLITPSRGPYRFSTIPPFWQFLEQKAQQGVIASPEQVFQELDGNGDELAIWAKKQRGTFFIPPDGAVQEAFRRIADFVKDNPRFAPQHVALFLKGADPWVIAHALALGGAIVTFEKTEPASKKPKIPDVAVEYKLTCINLWDLLSMLKWSAS